MADIVNPGASAGVINANALPANYDIALYAGDSLAFYVTVTDDSGTPISLSGSTPKAQMKTSYADGSPITITTTLTGQPGEVMVSLSASAVAALPATSYIYDFQITFTDGTVRTYLTGDISISPQVTT